MGVAGRRLLLRAAALLLPLVAATVCAVTSAPPSPRLSLRVGVPQPAKLRRVRMYSVEPDLQDVYNSSSLALVSRLQLLDYSDCAEDVTQCPVYAACDGGVAGPASCRCSRGFYLSQGQCQPCAKSVPEGQFLLTPCTRVRNAVFKACKVCSSTQYLAAPCTATQDTICVDVAFPVGILPWNQSLLEDVGADVRVEATDNVFLERLAAMTELEAPMYNSNNQQSMELVWERESGLQIKLQVTGDYLVPEYQEVPHDDDTNFFMYDRDVPESTKELFSRLKDNYCSHPMPDYYSLHLDVVQARTSAAQEVTCDSRNASVPACPPLYRDGDTFIRRDVNRNCSQLAEDESTHITVPLYDLGNSVVCPHTSPLLTSVFRLAPLSLQPLDFPSPACLQQRQQCQQCLQQPCPPNPPPGQSATCCNLQCYTGSACSSAFSPQCPPAPIQCATGDVNLFTLSPIFSSLGRQLSCHLAYRRPPYLYNVSYEVILPQLRLTLPFRNYSVGAGSRAAHQRQSLQLDFMHVQHDTFFAIHPEVVASAHHHNLSSPAPLTAFQVHALKQAPRDFQGGRDFSVQRDFLTRYATLVQFERPFLYSSSSFHRHGCYKNVSKVYPNQTVYKAESVRLQTKVFKRKEAGGGAERLTYQMYRKDQPPYIRLTVPAGQSILSTFQRVNSTALLPASLQASLQWVRAARKWRLAISGELSACPGILSLQLADRMLTRCLGHWDVFVACPPSFRLNLTFFQPQPQPRPKSQSRAQPQPQQPQQPQGPLPDIFVALLNDSITSHELVLSSIVSPRHLPSPAPPSSSSAALAARPPGQQSHAALWAPVVAVASLTLLGLLALLALHVCVRLQASRRPPPAPPAPPQALHCQEAEAPLNPNNDPNVGPNNAPCAPPGLPPEGEKEAGGEGGAGEGRGRQPASPVLVYVFVVLYVLYCLLCSFSLGLGLLYFAQLPLLHQLGNSSSSLSLAARLHLQMNASLEGLRRQEAARQADMLRGFQERQAACQQHLAQETERLSRQHWTLSGRQLAAIYVENGSLAHFAHTVLARHAQRHLEQSRSFIAACNASAHSHLAAFSSSFQAYLQQVASSPWLDFPREIFQHRDPGGEGGGALGEEGEAGLTERQLQRFLAWLQVDKAQQLLDLHRSIDSRLAEIVPSTASQTAPPFSHLPSLHQQRVAMTTKTRTQRYRYSVLPADTPTPATSPAGDATLTAQANASARSEDSGEGGKGGAMDRALYVLVACFLVLDLCLWSFRLVWLYRQVMAARQGYEDKIPTDAVSSQVLRIQTGHHTEQGAAEAGAGWEQQQQQHSYLLVRQQQQQQQQPEERWASDSELFVYFCQAYPKSKEDILREIWAHKMAARPRGAGGEGGGSGGAGGWLSRAQACCHWLHRVFLSGLLWRLCLLTLLALLICLLLLLLDTWILQGPLQWMFGQDLLTSELQWHTDSANQLLTSSAQQLNTQLQQLKELVDHDVLLLNSRFTDTVQRQTDLLVTLMAALCGDSASPGCNVSSLLLPLPAPVHTCNFLPVQPRLLPDPDARLLRSFVQEELLPLADQWRRLVFRGGTVLLLYVAAVLLCQALARLVRLYLLVSGQLPRVQVFQVSDTGVVLAEPPHDAHKQIQRTGSWLESCESGVYVGDNEDSTRESVI